MLLSNKLLGCLASAVNVIGPHNIYSATGNPSRKHDCRELSAERAQVARTHRRADHDDGLTPVGKQIVDGSSLAARRCKPLRTSSYPPCSAGGDRVEAVVIAASAEAQADLIVACAAAGKPIFCEKPASLTLENSARSLAAVESAGVILQVGFNRRFARDLRAAHDAIAQGAIGTPQLMRSLTRDPGLANPRAVPPWTIFLQTLIHDFDALLWFNPEADPVEVYATADALVAPDFKASALLDTAIVVITFNNGARAIAEASFSAAYG